MSKKILVVDDEPDIVQVVSFRLRNAGYDVVTALSGRKGLDLVESERPDLILLDLRLPDIEGYDICEKLKNDEKYKSIPVVLLTASIISGSVKKLESSGADDCILKPFDYEDLLEIVGKLIKKAK